MAQEYHSPVPGQIPIIAYAPIPQSLQNKIVINNPRKEQVRQIISKVKESGFNTILFGGDFDQIKYILDAVDVDPYKIPVIVLATYLTATPYSSVNAINTILIKDIIYNTENLKGWNIWDEPWYPMWGNATFGITDKSEIKSFTLEDWNRLSIGYKICSELTPDKLIYWNLAFPKPHNTKFLGNCVNYEQYLDILQELYKPALWSYDVYPIIQERATSEIEAEQWHFYRALRIFSNHAKKTQSRFWAFAMCAEHANYKNNTEWSDGHPHPTIGELRFEVFSALACGAQGIFYYRFGAGEMLPNTPFDYGYDKKLYFTAAPCTCEVLENPSDPDTIKFNIEFNEPLISNITTVNKEINNYKDVFLDAVPGVIYHAGQSYSNNSNSKSEDVNKKEKEIIEDGIKVVTELAPYFAIKICDSNGNFLSDSEIKNFKNSGVLMTTLINKDKKYAMIVSHDPFNAQQIHLTFYDPIYTLATPACYSEKPFHFSAIKPTPNIRPKGSLAISGYYLLGPGGYLIIEVSGK